MSAFPQPVICLVTDRRRLAAGTRTVHDEIGRLEAHVDEAIDAGVDLIQIRERDLAAAILKACVTRVVARAAGTATMILVNDRIDIAVAAGADGVHLRADGPSIARVRALASKKVVGRSIHPGEPVDALADADYALFGTVYATASKQAVTPAGIAPLRNLVLRWPAPVLAIGGITPVRARACRAAGAAGVAAIGLFLPEGLAEESLGVRRATRELRAAMSDAPTNLLE